MKRYTLLVLLFFVLSQSLFSRTSSIVIVDFENKGNASSTNEYASKIPTIIQKQLLNSANITIVERDKLQQVLKEQALGSSGVIDEGAAVKIGKMVGAEKLLLGEYQVNKKKRFIINSRFVDVEKGTVDAQWIAEDIKEKEIGKYCKQIAEKIQGQVDKTIALQNLADLQNAHPPFAVTVSADKDKFVYGEMLNISVLPEKDCYIHLFDVGTSGKIHLLFPNKVQPNTFVKADEGLKIGNLRVGPPAGVEMIKVIATLDSISVQEMLDIAATPATYELVGKDTDRFARDLELIVSPLPQDKWSTSTLEIVISDK